MNYLIVFFFFWFVVHDKVPDCFLHLDILEEEKDLTYSECHKYCLGIFSTYNNITLEHPTDKNSCVFSEIKSKDEPCT